MSYLGRIFTNLVYLSDQLAVSTTPKVRPRMLLQHRLVSIDTVGVPCSEAELGAGRPFSHHSAPFEQ